MKNNIDELLKTALTPAKMPDNRLNNQILMEVKEKKNMINMTGKKRIPAAAIIAVCVLIFGSVTALAAYHYLNPAQVATEFNDNALTEAFLSENAVLVNETQEIGNYRITLLGSVAGKNISDSLSYENGIPKDDRIYTVVAIEHTDGTPMPPTSADNYGEEAFYVSCYIHGLDPMFYSLMSMGGGYSAFVKDGTEYRLLEMNNIEMFADKGIYVGVSSGGFYDTDAYNYDYKTGDMTRNTNYNGVNALFNLPVDVSKADPEAAEAYLEELQNSWHSTGETDEIADKDENDLTIEEFIKKLTPENINEYAAPVESTRMVCTPDDKGAIHYEYKFESGAAGSGTESVEDLFPNGTTNTTVISGYNYSDKGLESLKINVFTLNSDGTITFVIYQPILQP